MNDSPSGHPDEQRGATKEVDTNKLKRIIKWRGGFMGRVDTEYPHPDQWTIDLCPGRRPMDMIGVREITTALRKGSVHRPW